MKIFKHFFIILPVLLFLTGCSTVGRLPVGEEISFDRTTYSFDKETHPYDIFSEYRIAPGDVLDVLFQIRTWVARDRFTLGVGHVVSVKFVNNPELNVEDQYVRPDGTISLPYIGQVNVLQKTVGDLTAELKQMYEKTLTNPELYVVVSEFFSAIEELKKDLHTAPRGLSRLVTVRPDGYVTFPMVGDFFVYKKTIPEVDKLLNERYNEMIPGLHCDLFLQKHSGSLIYVLGEVIKPGSYSISKPTSVMETLSLAGGILPSAQLNCIIIARKHEKKVVLTRINLESLLKFKKNSEFFYLMPDDVVFVPKSGLAKSAEIAEYIRQSIFFRGWGVGFSWELHNAGNENDTGLFF
ncbi:MAG: polysaccharide biosynthesis/export family protein [Candidatus Theseobacter exili]|nr:polysaccharide biosynthesis/export family protein [Candidatus Theseobacter exili]